jgi:hypothetical protein
MNLGQVVGQKVQPELLGGTYQRLCPHLAASGPPAVGPPSEPS